MQVEISKEQAKFLLEAITQKPVTTTIGVALGGIKLADDLMELVRKLEETTKDAEPKASESPSEATSESIEAEVVS